MGPNIAAFSARPHVLAFLCALALSTVLLPQRLHAAAPDESGLDASTLSSLEQRAAAAAPKERCYLYSELLHGWTELAGRAMSSGDEAAADSALQRADADVLQLRTALGNDSKRLKNAELLLEHSAHRLSDMVRVASLEQHDAMQRVLKHFNSVHDALLAQLFAH